MFNRPRAGLWAIQFAFLLIYSGSAQARVFSFTDEGFAPYIGGHYLSLLPGAESGYSQSGGVGNSFDKTYTTANEYEFGFAYGIKKFRLLFGLQYFKPAVLTPIGGTDAAGTALYAMENDLSAIIYKAGIEFDIKTYKEGRFFIEAHYGSANVTMASTYTFTAAGTAAYPSLIDFKEEIKGSGTMLEAGMGFEFVGFDSTSILLSLGYRQLSVAALTHNLAITNFQGNTAKGSPATNDDASARTLTLSGYYASLFFRFWLF